MSSLERDGLLSSSMGDVLRRHYDDACARGLELFPAGSEASSPINASPFVLDLATLERDFAFNPRRRRLLEGLKDVLAGTGSIQIDPVFLMIGGSFLDQSTNEPGDLDCALFYVTRTSAGGGSKASIRDLQKRGQDKGVDIRLMPFDTYPALVAKLISFFAVLYARQRDDGRHSALVIVDIDQRDLSSVASR